MLIKFSLYEDKMLNKKIHLGKINNKNIEINFTEGALTSDAGLLALKKI
jgi:hypothetical protein